MNICDLKHGLEILSAVLAFMAAASWFVAAWAGRGSFTNTPIGDLDRSFRRQAKFNAIAAFSAGCAAILQYVVVTHMPICRAFA